MSMRDFNSPAGSARGLKIGGPNIGAGAGTDDGHGQLQLQKGIALLGAADSYIDDGMEGDSGGTMLLSAPSECCCGGKYRMEGGCSRSFK